MANLKISIGTRSSRLALTQTGDAIDRLGGIFPTFDFKTLPFSSPGDRDRQTDLKASDPDFFTRDLDEAVINGEIDAAVHSAKDLPETINPAIDWFWLPWFEDQRDVLIGNLNLEPENSSDHQITKSLNYRIRIGVSSERREEYCRKRFPEAKLLPIRGNIEERIAQLDAGKYDLLIMAAAGLKRLGLADRISEYVPLAEMPPPPGQGYLAMTFRKGDRRFEIMRSLFVKPVVFAGSGPGNPELATVACVNALKHCDICLYDSLAPEELLLNIPDHARAEFVGKRSGRHSKKQHEISHLITEYARQGKAVVRLKGGDAGIFGRLAEEVEILDEFSLPYRVIPGISSLQSASGETGLLLTRRGVSRGFAVMTPRKEGSAEYQTVSGQEILQFPRVYFMGKSVLDQVTGDLLAEGWKKNDPAAVVFAAGTEDESVISGTIADIAAKTAVLTDDDRPGLLIAGANAAEKYLYRHHGALARKKILVTCSENRQGKAACEIRRFGGKPIAMPLIKLTPALVSQPPSVDLCRTTAPGCPSLIAFDYKNHLEITERHLPHWNQEGVTYFVTFRLADSIPLAKIKEIKKEREMWIQRNSRHHGQSAAGLGTLQGGWATGGGYPTKEDGQAPTHSGRIFKGAHVLQKGNRETNLVSFAFSSLSQDEKDEYYHLFTERVQDLLDAGTGSCVLSNPEIAEIAAKTITFFDGEKYKLGEWVIMPNHIHAIVTPLGNNNLSEILAGWKSVSSRKINRLLGRKGQLWLHETYDHIIRNKEQLKAMEKYIRNNPVKAKIKNFKGSLSSANKSEDGQAPTHSERIFKGVYVLQKGDGQPGAVTLQREIGNRGQLPYKEYDYLLLTSPAAVQIFLNSLAMDLRKLPKIMVCGPGTAGEFREKGIIPDLEAEDDFGKKGMIRMASEKLAEGTKILRLCSDKADNQLSCELRRLGFAVEDRILYSNTLIKYEALPEFDAVMFASSSAVEAFVENFGKKSLKNKTIAVIGEPTLKTLRQRRPSSCEIAVAREATISGTVSVLAEYYVNEKLLRKCVRSKR